MADSLYFYPLLFYFSLFYNSYAWKKKKGWAIQNLVCLGICISKVKQCQFTWKTCLFGVILCYERKGPWVSKYGNNYQEEIILQLEQIKFCPGPRPVPLIALIIFNIPPWVYFGGGQVDFSRFQVQFSPWLTTLSDFLTTVKELWRLSESSEWLSGPWRFSQPLS